MTDPELDDLLRRYRPSGPPAELRAHVVVAAVPARRTWPWAVAAAGLLAAVCGMQLWTQHVYERVHDSVASVQTSILTDLPALQSAVEQDPLLRERVETLARQEQLQSAPSLVNGGSGWR